MHTYPLICHPASPCSVANTLEVTISPHGNGGLLLRYRLTGDIAELCLPQAGASGAADDLWRHTCFEAFVAQAGAPAYREFNFSPSGQWAVYAFSGTRQRDSYFQPPAAPEITVRRFQNHLELEAALALELLPEGANLHLGLTAVIEARDGTLSYWALTHPAEKPDFHLREGFTARLPLGPEIHRANTFAPPSP